MKKLIIINCLLLILSFSLTAFPATVGSTPITSDPEKDILKNPARIPEIQKKEASLNRFLPNSGNNVQESSRLFRSWPAGGPQELWRVAIGNGKSSIVAGNGRIYTLVQTDKQQFAICLEAATGKTLWKKLLVAKDNHHVVTGPVNGPILDDNRLYVFPYEAENDDLWEPRCPCFCLNIEDGSTIWSEHKEFNCSEGSTPLIVNDVLYIGGGGRENTLAAVDKRTGKLLWKIPESIDAGHERVFVTGASLTYQMVDDIPQIIVPVFRNDIMGVHALTGQVLWHWKLENPTSSGIVPTPVAIGSRLFLSAFQGAVSFSQCLEMTVKGDSIIPKLIYKDARLQCNMYHTPSIVDGAIFGFGKGTEHDALQCTALEDGRLIWQQEVEEWRTDRQLTVADGLIFAITKKDELVLAEAGRNGYKEFGRVAPGIPLGIPQQPMIVGGKLYLRGETIMVCYQIGEE